MVGPNKHVYLERQSYPVDEAGPSPQSLGARVQAGTTPLFNAALVSFGSFGIIHGLMIETRELFALNALRFKGALRRHAEGGDHGAATRTTIPLPAFARGRGATDKPYHFELFLNPNEACGAQQRLHPGDVRDRLRSRQLMRRRQWDGGEVRAGRRRAQRDGGAGGQHPEPARPADRADA